jgi:hypothetical protein
LEVSQMIHWSLNLFTLLWIVEITWVDLYLLRALSSQGSVGLWLIVMCRTVVRTCEAVACLPGVVQAGGRFAPEL